MNDRDKIDQHVSKRLHLRRALLGMKIKSLSQKVDLFHQKLSSCEDGRSIISAGLLFELGKALDVPVTYFYEGLYKNDPLEKALNDLSELPAAFFEDNFFIQPENFELLGNYHKISNDEVKRDIHKLMKSVADSAL